MQYNTIQKHQRSKLAEHFHVPKMFGVRQPKFRLHTNSYPILLEMHRDQKQFHIIHEKYKTLYNSVPTSDSDLSNIKNTLVERLHPSEVSNLDLVTPELICHCIGKLKPGKGEGSEGFRSDQLINAGKSSNVLELNCYPWSLSTQFINFYNYIYTKGFKIISEQF